MAGHGFNQGAQKPYVVSCPANTRSMPGLWSASKAKRIGGSCLGR